MGGKHVVRGRISSVLEHCVKKVLKNEHGIAVMTKALSHAGSDGRLSIVRAISQEQNLIVKMARFRHGPKFVHPVLELMDDQDRNQLKKLLLDNATTFRKSPYWHDLF